MVKQNIKAMEIQENENPLLDKYVEMLNMNGFYSGR